MVHPVRTFLYEIFVQPILEILRQPFARRPGSVAAKLYPGSGAEKPWGAITDAEKKEMSIDDRDFAA